MSLEGSRVELDHRIGSFGETFVKLIYSFWFRHNPNSSWKWIDFWAAILEAVGEKKLD